MKIERGCTRIVFVFKKFVIKIPNLLVQYDHFLYGLLANLQEKNMYGKHKDLAKVFYCNKLGIFLIMEKAEVVSNDIDIGEFCDLLTDKYKDDKLKEFMLSDWKPSNWGYIRGRLVKIDYGDFK